MKKVFFPKAAMAMCIINLLILLSYVSAPSASLAAVGDPNILRSIYCVEIRGKAFDYVVEKNTRVIKETDYGTILESSAFAVDGQGTLLGAYHGIAPEAALFELIKQRANATLTTTNLCRLELRYRVIGWSNYIYEGNFILWPKAPGLDPLDIKNYDIVTMSGDLKLDQLGPDDLREKDDAALIRLKRAVTVPLPLTLIPPAPNQLLGREAQAYGFHLNAHRFQTLPAGLITGASLTLLTSSIRKNDIYTISIKLAVKDGYSGGPIVVDGAVIGFTVGISKYTGETSAVPLWNIASFLKARISQP
jgi:hypothetical protein